MNPCPLLSIVIPVHNQSGYTRACLESLRQHPPSAPFEIIVVNDGSTDDTYQVVAGFSGLLPVRLTDNPPPHRFARACNRGAAEARGELLLFLNNDTEALPGWWEPLYRTVADDPTVGLAAPRLLFPDLTVQHCGKVWVDVTAPDAQPYHLYYRFPHTHPAVLKSRDFQTVTGACILVRAAEFRQLGGFDEAFENGWEDDDLCYAYRRLGRRIRCCAESSLIHHQNQTLNERMRALERRLPEQGRLRRLDEAFSAGSVTPDDLALALDTRGVFDAMEQELLRLREKFRDNRHRFFSKWGGCPSSDLLDHTDTDGVSPFDALGEQAPRDMIAALLRQGGRQGGMMPLVSMIMLTYNRLDVTQACLESIRRHTPEPHEIIVVDNGSDDGSREWLRQRRQEQPTIRLIENGQNLGFAAGCNQGMREARGDYLLLLNNDTVVTPGWLSGLLEPFADPAVGITGPMTNSASGIQQWPWCDYRNQEELDAFARRFRDEHRHWWLPSRRIVGFCMLFRRSLVERIGLLDEQFGSGNFEDDDFCLRAALAGYRNMIVGDVFIHHEGSATFAGNRLDYREAMLRNQALFTAKWSRPVVDREEAVRIIRLKTLEKAAELCHRGESNRAVELLLQEGIGQVPEEPRFYHALAEIFLETAMHQEALDVLREAPAGGRTSVLSARALLGLGRLPEAVAELDRAGDADEAERLTVRGLLLAHLENRAGAAHALQQALERSPVCSDALEGLAELALRDGDRQTALQMRERAAVCSGGNEGALARYHALVQTPEELHRGERLFRELRHCHPDLASLTSLHIDLLLRLGRDAEAMAAIEGLIAAGPQPDGFLEAALLVRSRLGLRLPAPERVRQGTAVALCMIVKDEEKSLARCLASATPVADEIVVVDTGSVDRTRDIAALFGARVLELPWSGDYAAARNRALEPVTSSWVLSLDADEVLSPLDHGPLRDLVAASAGRPVAYTITTRNYTNRVDVENWQANRGEYPHEEAGRGWMPSDKVRLFPHHPQVRFENPIHEMVEPSLERLGIGMRDCPVVVHHYGYLDDSRQQRKKEYYYELGKRKFEESGGSPHALVELAIQAGGVGRYDEAIELWHRALQIDPASYLAWFNLGYACLQKGLFREGRDAGYRAMELRANYREAAVNTAICEAALGDFAAAHRVVAAFLPANPDYPTLPLMEALLLAATGAGETAVHRLTALRDNAIEFSGFIHEIAVKLVQGGQREAARRLVDTTAQGGFCSGETLDFMRRHLG